MEKKGKKEILFTNEEKIEILRNTIQYLIKRYSRETKIFGKAKLEISHDNEFVVSFKLKLSDKTFKDIKARYIRGTKGVEIAKEKRMHRERDKRWREEIERLRKLYPYSWREYLPEEIKKRLASGVPL